ncbi:MAG: hypothetical protein ACKVX9_23385 [Blastocatellia bacterium]
MMTGISNDQRNQDERALLPVLVVFNVALLAAFVLICLSQSMR